MTEDIKKMLIDLGKSDYGDALKDYLEEKLRLLRGDIENVDSWEDILARRKAKKIVKEIFYFLEPEKVEPKEKNQYM